MLSLSEADAAQFVDFFSPGITVVSLSRTPSKYARIYQYTHTHGTVRGLFLEFFSPGITVVSLSSKYARIYQYIHTRYSSWIISLQKLWHICTHKSTHAHAHRGFAPIQERVRACVRACVLHV